MKDSQRGPHLMFGHAKYIKANNERFSTGLTITPRDVLSISRRIMKDSQQIRLLNRGSSKYIKANNERFSTWPALNVWSR